MSLITRRLVGAAILSAATAIASLPAFAQTAPTIRVRGTIESLEGSSLVVKSRDGKSVPIALAEGWGVSGIKKAAMTDIKPGTFVGIAAAGRGGWHVERHRGAGVFRPA